MIKGYIPNFVFKRLKKELKAANIKVELILAKLLKEIFKRFREDIWKKHNKKVHEEHVYVFNQEPTSQTWNKGPSLFNKFEKRTKALEKTVDNMTKRLTTTFKDALLYNKNRWKQAKRCLDDLKIEKGKGKENSQVILLP